MVACVALLFVWVVGSAVAFAPSSPSPSGVGQRSRAAVGALPKEKLLELAKDYVANPSPEKWAEDFVFRGPVIGPLAKKDLVSTLGSVSKDLGAAFPDMKVFGFTADDPVEPNRVWFFTRPNATFTGPFTHPTAGLIEPTGAAYVAPPEARSLVFNEDGLIKLLTVGYVTDRFTGDTTGGRGAVFGLYAVMGQKIDATVGSLATSLIQRVAMLLPDIPKSYSREEDIPAWWTDKRRGAEA